MLIVHPHEVFFEAVDLGFSTDDPVIVHNHAVDAWLFRRKDAVSLLEVVQAAQVPEPTSTTFAPYCKLPKFARRDTNKTQPDADIMCSHPPFELKIGTPVTPALLAFLWLSVLEALTLYLQYCSVSWCLAES